MHDYDMDHGMHIVVLLLFEYEKFTYFNEVSGLGHFKAFNNRNARNKIIYNRDIRLLPNINQKYILW